MTVHDAMSKRKRLIGQFHLFIKPASAGFCFYRAAGWMTVHDTIPERKRLIGQFHLFIKPVSVSWRGFAFIGRQDE
ncbi:hypothetical protein EJJ51_02800 [Salmonella enterica subsp. enterica serovar Offa]|nr:hypothetical protein [Salmonella enterica]ECA2188963.1 hypothetical protein [Salmonella enterica subsp. enterica serovar Offa]